MNVFEVVEQGKEENGMTPVWIGKAKTKKKHKKPELIDHGNIIKPQRSFLCVCALSLFSLKVEVFWNFYFRIFGGLGLGLGNKNNFCYFKCSVILRKFLRNS